MSAVSDRSESQPSQTEVLNVKVFLCPCSHLYETGPGGEILDVDGEIDQYSNEEVRTSFDAVAAGFDN